MALIGFAGLANDIRSNRDDTSLLIRLLNDQTQQIKHLRDDNISAVQSLKHDLLITMQKYQNNTLQAHDASLRTLGDQLAKLARSSSALEQSDYILNSLYCGEVHSRELRVSPAASCTFDWAFDAWCSGHRWDCGCLCTESTNRTRDGKCIRHRKSVQPPCADGDSHRRHLLDWLEGDNNEPFIITGKPGSGKSTFMKFIASHERTRLSLTSWAGSNRILSASFYFWSSGSSPMQRSQEGLLRCLLYEILSQAPELIPIAVPKRWIAVAGPLRSNELWTRKDVLDAFSNIVVHGNPSNANFCFFIDGLDEFGGPDLEDGGSDLELVLLLKKLSSSPHIKLCLSSRPRNIFQSHLINDESRHITLHNHTAKDIERFVQSRIDHVRPLIHIDAPDLKQLQQLVAQKSSGVFLWVVLVVRELLDGMEPPFSMPEMRERLLLLPATLDDYFQRILNNIHQQYRRFTARILLMLAREGALGLETAYFIWLLDKGDVYSPQQQPHVLSENWQRDTCARLRKSCGDLLDIVTEDEHSYFWYTHRSVVDFLTLPEIESQLFLLAGWQEPEIHYAFCRDVVSTIDAGIATFNNGITDLDTFMKNAEKYESHSGKPCDDLIYQLDALLCSRPTPVLKDRHAMHWIEAYHISCFPEFAISEADALLFYATMYGLQLFFEQVMGSVTPQNLGITLNNFLRAQVLGCYHLCQAPSGVPLRAHTVAFLCGKGASPNSIVRMDLSHTADHKTTTLDWTIWELYLHERRFSYEHTYWKSARIPKDPCTVMEKLIESGANLECKIPEGCASVQQAIETRLQADYGGREDVHVLDEIRSRVKTVLLKRGFIWVEDSHSI